MKKSTFYWIIINWMFIMSIILIYFLFNFSMILKEILDMSYDNRDILNNIRDMLYDIRDMILQFWDYLEFIS